MTDLSSEIALLLYAIGYECHHKGSASVKGILSAEDAINCSAPTFEELAADLSTLLTAGLITGDDDGIVLTADGKQLYDTVNQQEGSVFERLSQLKSNLRSRLATVRVDQLFGLDATAFQTAYNAYYRAT